MTKPSILQVKQRFSIIGHSQELDRSIDIALQVAPTDLSVLITGESGVGKENFPQIIHQYSKRKHGPYFAINCGSIPEGTIDSELFGHEKGAFTGALTTRKGYFEVADKGTLFLDEVGELPLSTQARLLRVLETGEFIKVGSSNVEKSDVRVVAATNLDMIKAVEKGKFREDLYYRLNSVPIRIPPLRDRKNDIPLLFKKFAMDCSEKYTMPPINLTDSAKELLMNFRWPGNVRQLKNITEQISVPLYFLIVPENESSLLPVPISHIKETEQRTFANEREILYQILFDMKKDIGDLKQVVANIISESKNNSNVSESSNYLDSQLPVIKPDKTSVTLPVDFKVPDLNKTIQQKNIEKDDDIQDATEYSEEARSLHEIEKEMIIKALDRNNGKRKLAAKELKISERTLYRKIKEYKLEDL